MNSCLMNTVVFYMDDNMVNVIAYIIVKHELYLECNNRGIKTSISDILFLE